MSDQLDGVESLVVYDPDSVNPYSRELCAVLKALVAVTLLVPRSVAWIPDGYEVRPILAGSRASDGLVRTLFLRLAGPLKALLAAAGPSRVLVVVWTRHSWDAAVFTAASRCGQRIIVINHNPTALRGRRGLHGMAERAMKRCALRTTVHDSAMLSAAKQESRRVEVAGHPSYSRWQEEFAPERARSSCGNTVLFLGALRADKGVDDAVLAATGFGAGVRVLFAGRGELTESQLSVLTEADVPFTISGGGRFLDDAELAEALEAAHVMVAPYVGATQSGSVILALSCGLPVLAYRVGGLPSLLTDSSLVAPGEADILAKKVKAFLASPWPTHRVSAKDLDDACRLDWARILSTVGRRPHGP